MNVICGLTVAQMVLFIKEPFHGNTPAYIEVRQLEEVLTVLSGQHDLTKTDLINIAGIAMLEFENMGGLLQPTTVSDLLYRIASTCIQELGGSGLAQHRWAKKHGIVDNLKIPTSSSEPKSLGDILKATLA